MAITWSKKPITWLGTACLAFTFAVAGCAPVKKIRELAEAPPEAFESAPQVISYGANPAEYVVGVAITANEPMVTGGRVEKYTCEPDLPDGLSLDEKSGIISGTPQNAQNDQGYTVTASNIGGSASTILKIKIKATP